LQAGYWGAMELAWAPAAPAAMAYAALRGCHGAQ